MSRAIDRAARGSRRIVDLMRDAGGKRAQGDQRLRCRAVDSIERAVR